MHIRANLLKAAAIAALAIAGPGLGWTHGGGHGDGGGHDGGGHDGGGHDEWRSWWRVRRWTGMTGADMAARATAITEAEVVMAMAA